MVQWLLSLPKTIFVTLVLAVGVLLIVLSDPPRTVCDSQIDLFNESSKGFLQLDAKKPVYKVTQYSKLMDTCKSTNAAGGCFELFMNLKQMIKDAKTVSPECYGKLGDHTQFKAAVWQSLDLMVQLAWGDKPPLTPVLKAGWLDPADLNLFCELRSIAIDVFGQTSWNGFIEPYFKSLPKADTLSRNDAWQRMLFSINCGLYL